MTSSNMVDLFDYLITCAERIIAVPEFQFLIMIGIAITICRFVIYSFTAKHKGGDF